jgi:hypothetical protein
MTIEIWLFVFMLVNAGLLGWALRGISDRNMYTSKEAFDEMSYLAGVMAKKLDDEGIAVRFEK